jgi:hypothetical protein
MKRDTRNQPKIKYTSPRDTDLCKRHRQLHETVHVLKKGEYGSLVSLTVVKVVTLPPACSFQTPGSGSARHHPQRCR